MRAALLLLLLAGPPAATATRAATLADLEAAAAQVAAAGDVLERAENPGDRVRALAAAIPAYERALAAVREVAVGAGVAERQIAGDLAARRDEVMRLAAALQSMTRTPPPVQTLHPAGPLAAARASALMAELTPALAGEAGALRDELAALDQARRLRGAALDDLSAGLERLTAARGTLRGDMAGRPGATGEADAAAEALQASLVRDSDTLGALAETLARGPARPAANAEEPDGTMLWPVAGGRQVLGFRERDAGGERRPGILVAAPPLSLVSAPADAMVRYAGPFLEYGYVVVLETGGGTVTILAGLAQLNVRAGDPVTRGDLLGLLGGRNLNAEEYVMLPAAETGADAAETLYIEIRHERGPVDPAPWFDGGNG